MVGELQELRRENEQLRSYIEAVDMSARSSNLIVSGLKLKEGEMPLTCVTSLFVEVLKLSPRDLQVVDAFRLGPPGGNAAIMVKLASEPNVQAVLRNTAKLRGSTIRISCDLPPRIRERSNRMLGLRFELRKILPDVRVKIRGDKMFVNNNKFEWAAIHLSAEKRMEYWHSNESTGRTLARLSPTS
ncbi:Hypothetical protein NTJ_15017 [Nesidiocoris tenuis]|uniref:RRM domain-containing protein n=1 Tax=Nesidiocoris tenuis TaxID=355587 RepID=A0ABN7BD17_9HEMI|nr:Hypothetical protein NTJ_15017 [Nesidiocoris tenuis]